MNDASTHGHLLGGRVIYAQPAEGFRSGIEPVLLAAAVPARPGERVLEGGSGAGAALLCLAARVPGVLGLGVERDPVLTRLAEHNAAANNATGLAFATADLTAPADIGMFHHACANPPYHPQAGTRSPLSSRDSAKRGRDNLLADWTAALAAALRHRGTLTLILSAALVPESFAAMAAAGCRPTALLPLLPAPDRPAKLALVHGIKGGRSPLRLLAGLVLHAEGGGFTPAAEAILRDGAALKL